MSTENALKRPHGARKGPREHGDNAPAADQPVQHSAPQGPLAWANAALEINLVKSVRARRIAFLRRLMLFIGLPTLLAVGYVYWYASPRYVSEFQVTYESFDQPSAIGGQASLLSAMFGLGGSTIDMSRVIASYLTSTDALSEVDKHVGLRAHYSAPKIDWLDRLSPRASLEQFLAYFQRRVSVDALMGGYIIVDVEAFDPATAAKAAEALVSAADQMVETITDRALKDEVRVAETELARTQGRLLNSTLAVTNFRNLHHNFDPQAAAAQLGAVVGALEGQLSGYRAALESARSYLDEHAPAVQALRSQIRATEQEIGVEQSRLANTERPAAISGKRGDSEPYSLTVADYVALVEEQQFATDEYTSVKQALDAARANAASKRKYVNCFVRPNVPQESTSPSPLRVITETFVVAVLAYIVGSLLIGAFRDQAGA
jgi:capsular polysaccharide transport system permease protein